MQPGVAGQRRDPLVEPRVVLHRAGAERVEARVEVEVAPREPVVVADDLRLGDLGQLGRLGAEEPLRDQLLERALGDVASAGSVAGAAARRPSARRSCVAGSRCCGVGVSAVWAPRGRRRRSRPRLLRTWRVLAASAKRAIRRRRARPSASASRSMSARDAPLGDRHQQPVLVLGVLAARAGSRRRSPRSATRSSTAATGASRRTANSRTTGASCSSSTPSTAASRSRA